MFEFFANIFGYLLGALYNLINNYGFAILLFTVIIKIAMLPISIKQQKSLKKSAYIQDEIKKIQFKYKNDPEKMNQEIMRFYKEKKASPFSGCLSTIIQFVLLFSIFYLVRCPLTYMEKIPSENIENYKNQLTESGIELSKAYPEIDLIRETSTLQEKNPDDSEVNKTSINMEFIGLDLSKIPQQNLSDYTVYVIPILYIISSFISIRLTTAMQEKNKKGNNDKNLLDITENKEEKELVEKEEKEIDTMAQTNKMMSWMMPILSISIAFIAPLGLALYWLINNILMILERVVLDKFLKTEED